MQCEATKRYKNNQTKYMDVIFYVYFFLEITINKIMTRIAIVTGSNKGIGFGIVRALCKQFDGFVYLTGKV